MAEPQQSQIFAFEQRPDPLESSEVFGDRLPPRSPVEHGQDQDPDLWRQGIEETCHSGLAKIRGPSQSARAPSAGFQVSRKLLGDPSGRIEPSEDRDNCLPMQRTEQREEKRRFWGGRLEQRQRAGLSEDLLHAVEQVENSRGSGEPWVDSRKNAQVIQAPHDAHGRRLLHNQAQLGEYPRTSKMPQHPPAHRFLYQSHSAPSDRKSVSGFKPSSPENPGRVVDETPLMQDPDPTPPQVFTSSQRIDQRAKPMAIDTGCHGIDAEVAPGKIGRELGRSNLGEGSNLRVSLRPGGGQIEGDTLRQRQASGPEPGMWSHRHIETLTHTSRHSDSVSLDHEIDIDRVEAEEQVPNITTHGIDGARCGSGVGRLKSLSGFRREFSKPGEPPQIF